jgi:hypothetical protein
VSSNLTGISGALLNSLVGAIPATAIATNAISNFAGVGINVGPSADYLGIRADCGGFPRLVK